MRLIDADMGEQELQRIYAAWCLAMAPAEGREIAYVDKQQRLVKLVLAFFKRLPTVEPPPNVPLTLDELREMAGQWVWVVVQYEHCECAGWAFVPTPAYIAYLDQTISMDLYGKIF